MHSLMSWDAGADAKHATKWETEMIMDMDASGPPAPVCGPMLFAVGAAGSFVATAAVEFAIPGASASRVLAVSCVYVRLLHRQSATRSALSHVVGASPLQSGSASGSAMIIYAHYAGDKVNLRAWFAVTATALLVAAAVLHMEDSFHRHDRLLMALLPNVGCSTMHTIWRCNREIGKMPAPISVQKLLSEPSPACSHNAHAGGRGSSVQLATRPGRSEAHSLRRGREGAEGRRQGKRAAERAANEAGGENGC
eukprot:SAG11_NODE_27_length_23309_cov_10.579362_24_plen_252_part_00